MAIRSKLIAGNWKMNKDRQAAIELASQIARGLSASSSPDNSNPDDVDVAIFPAAPFLADAVAAVSSSTHPINVGAQNIYFENSGAFTGEISASMVLSTGASWVILGHSERRHVFGESDSLIGQKVRKSVDSSLEAILCVGETLEERERGETEDVVLRQLKAGLKDLETDEISRIAAIAYEPVWAIGTGKTATPQQGQEVHHFLRSETAKLTNSQTAEDLRILYGGSVKPENVKDLLSQPDIDGVLVGGASLDAESFLSLCHWNG